VKDFARLIDMVLLAPENNVNFEIFNSGGEVNNFTKKMIVDTIQKHLPDAKIIYGKNGSDPRNYRVSFQKVKNILGFEPQWTVEDGIKELLESFNLGLYRNAMVDKNMYGNYKINYKK
jgi:nucleoside-diphosphate-sugar epimerase